MQLTANDIARRAGGEVVAGDADALATSFAFDSRGLERGACFVALRGSRDGHDFVGDALAAGAAVAIVEHVPEGVRARPGQAIVRVADPQAALHALARSVRDERPDLAVIGVTGSSGKTSTKDMLQAAFSTTGAVHANRDSYNNEVGLPLTLLGIDPTTRYVVTEMGARFAGNITELCQIARPTVGVVTNVGLAHAEHLGGPEGVARVKAELLECLPPDGLAVLNADDQWTKQLAARARCEVRTVGEHAGADVPITNVRIAEDLRVRCRVGDLEIDVPLRGAHQVHNAALAVVVAQHFGIPAHDIALGLAAARASRWRMELDRSAAGVAVLNDAYNANPASMEAALRALAQLPVRGRRIAVLGEMRELGDHATDAHRAIGTLVATLGIDFVVGVGEGGAAIAGAADGVASVNVRDAHDAIVDLAARARAGDAVLVKASRAVGLEVVAESLLGASWIAMLMAAAAAFFIAIGGTPLLIRWLRARGIGAHIRDDGPLQHPHIAKAGTPTMGGLAIVGATVVGYLFAHLRRGNVKFASAGWSLLILIVGLGIVGFIDDYLGVRARRNLGLRKRGKTGGIVVVGGGFAALSLQWVDVSTKLSFTRPLHVGLGTVGWFIWAVLVVYATANAVNITDGLDGLVAGSAVLVFIAFVIIAFTEFRHPEVYEVLPAQALDLAIIAAAMMGACAGFLWWNAAPARIFMGDTGALAIGGAIAGLALLTRTALLLPLLGGLYLVETLSVLAQIVSYRGFKRRVLRMAPIHHHFEVGGWSEFTVIVRFWLFAGACVAFGVGLFYADFLRVPGILE